MTSTSHLLAVQERLYREAHAPAQNVQQAERKKQAEKIVSKQAEMKLSDKGYRLSAEEKAKYKQESKKQMAEEKRQTQRIDNILAIRNELIQHAVTQPDWDKFSRLLEQKEYMEYLEQEYDKLGEIDLRDQQALILLLAQRWNPNDDSKKNIAKKLWQHMPWDKIEILKSLSDNSPAFVNFCLNEIMSAGALNEVYERLYKDERLPTEDKLSASLKSILIDRLFRCAGKCETKECVRKSDICMPREVGTDTGAIYNGYIRTMFDKVQEDEKIRLKKAIRKYTSQGNYEQALTEIEKSSVMEKTKKELQKFATDRKDKREAKLKRRAERRAQRKVESQRLQAQARETKKEQEQRAREFREEEQRLAEQATKKESEAEKWKKDAVAQIDRCGGVNTCNANCVRFNEVCIPQQVYDDSPGIFSYGGDEWNRYLNQNGGWKNVIERYKTQHK